MDTVPPPPPSVAPIGSTPTDDKTVAIVSYLTLIGFVIALVMHGKNKSALGTFHLRQSLGLMILAVCCWVVNMILIFIPILGWLLMFCIAVSLFILWILGIISAVNGTMKPLPVIGVHFQKWFGTAFA